MNKQRKVIENKQRLPPFSPPPLCANRGNAANICNCTNHQDRELKKITRIKSFKKSPGSRASKNHQDQELQKITRIESFKKSPGSRASKITRIKSFEASNLFPLSQTKYLPLLPILLASWPLVVLFLSISA